MCSTRSIFAGVFLGLAACNPITKAWRSLTPPPHPQLSSVCPAPEIGISSLISGLHTLRSSPNTACNARLYGWGLLCLAHIEPGALNLSLCVADDVGRRNESGFLDEETMSSVVLFILHECAQVIGSGNLHTRWLRGICPDYSS